MKTAIYRAATLTLSLELLAGGVADILRVNWASTIMVHLGYPPCMMFIIGISKVLGSVAIIVPFSETVREWAYAGIFFEITGALASHLLSRDAVAAIGPPVAFTLITLLSWKLWKDRLKDAALGELHLSDAKWPS